MLFTEVFDCCIVIQVGLINGVSVHIVKADRNKKVKGCTEKFDIGQQEKGTKSIDQRGLDIPMSSEVNEASTNWFPQPHNQLEVTIM